MAEAPNHKDQAPNKFQTASSNDPNRMRPARIDGLTTTAIPAPANIRTFEFGDYLLFGACNLELYSIVTPCAAIRAA
jgi:hypothetical protein